MRSSLCKVRGPRRTAAAAVAMLASLSASFALAQESELDDLAVRIDYGYYAGDTGLVAAASAALERMPMDDPRWAYLAALSRYRLAQLHIEAGNDAPDSVSPCIELATSIEQALEPDAGLSRQRAREQTMARAEASILVAACSTLASAVEPLKSPLHNRRRDQALERARAADPTNPRLTLLATSSAEAQAADVAAYAATAAALERAIAEFDARAGTAGPQWGKAEALTQLAQLRLLEGERRAARDLVERALLAAPDYRHAEQLLERVLRE